MKKVLLQKFQNNETEPEQEEESNSNSPASPAPGPSRDVGSYDSIKSLAPPSSLNIDKVILVFMYSMNCVIYPYILLFSSHH